MMKNEDLANRDGLREHVLDWLRANGIDPNDIPADPTMTLDGDQLTTDVFLRKDGRKLFAADGMIFQRDVATLTITVPPPDDVAEWLRTAARPAGDE